VPVIGVKGKKKDTTTKKIQKLRMINIVLGDQEERLDNFLTLHLVQVKR